MFSVRQEVSVKYYLDALQAYDCIFLSSQLLHTSHFFSERFPIKYLCVVNMPHAQPITIRMTLRVFLIPDTSCCLQVLTGISRLCAQVATNARRPIRVQNPGPFKDRDTESGRVHHDSKYGVLSCVI